MAFQQRVTAGIRTIDVVYTKVAKALVLVLAVLAGLSILVMIVVTCVDVLGRKFGHPLTGAFDIVTVMGAVSMACALPYTTAVKGHVAVEYFFHKLNHRGRLIVDTVIRLAGVVMFAFLSWQCVQYGGRLREAGQVTMTLQMPVFWVPYVIAGSSVVVAIVIFYNMTHPGKTLVRP
mgnify:CR=1 FL=1